MVPPHPSTAPLSPAPRVCVDSSSRVSAPMGTHAASRTVGSPKDRKARAPATAKEKDHPHVTRKVVQDTPKAANGFPVTTEDPKAQLRRVRDPPKDGRPKEMTATRVPLRRRTGTKGTSRGDLATINPGVHPNRSIALPFLVPRASAANMSKDIAPTATLAVLRTAKEVHPGTRRRGTERHAKAKITREPREIGSRPKDLMAKARDQHAGLIIEGFANLDKVVPGNIGSSPTQSLNGARSTSDP